MTMGRRGRESTVAPEYKHVVVQASIKYSPAESATSMQTCVRLAAFLFLALLCVPFAHAQNLPAQKISRIPDLSGNWLAGPAVQSISLADPAGKMRGKEPDIPYQPWSLQKTLSEYPPTGPDTRYELTTDPWINYCEPPALWRIYIQPGRTIFVQMPDAVYILHEVMQQFRIIRLNGTHPKDPDPTWWGDSIGWYENGDTLVVDSIGFNDKTWLDQLGHPHTEQLHYIERYRRVNPGTLELEVTIDDPGAYTRPFTTKRTFKMAMTPFMQDPWVCSVRENNEHKANLAAPAVTPPAPAPASK